jgi:hypothetical protein
LSDDPSQGEIMAHFMRLAAGRRSMGIRTVDGMSLYTAYHCGAIDEWGEATIRCTFCGALGHGHDTCDFKLHAMEFIDAHKAQFEAFVRKVTKKAKVRSFADFEEWSAGEQLAHFRGNTKMFSDYHSALTNSAMRRRRRSSSALKPFASARRSTPALVSR